MRRRGRYRCRLRRGNAVDLRACAADARPHRPVEFPPEDSEAEFALLRDARLAVIPSGWAITSASRQRTSEGKAAKKWALLTFPWGFGVVRGSCRVLLIIAGLIGSSRCGRRPIYAGCGLPRVFRTVDFAFIYAASCEFRYSVRTSCGVR